MKLVCGIVFSGLNESRSSIVQKRFQQKKERYSTPSISLARVLCPAPFHLCFCYAFDVLAYYTRGLSSVAVCAPLNSHADPPVVPALDTGMHPQSCPVKISASKCVQRPYSYITSIGARLASAPQTAGTYAPNRVFRVSSISTFHLDEGLGLRRGAGFSRMLPPRTSS